MLKCILATDVVKRELQSLRNFYTELKERLDSHTHPDYGNIFVFKNGLIIYWRKFIGEVKIWKCQSNGW